MDTALPQKFPFILDRNLARAKSTENPVCTSCVTVVLGDSLYILYIYIYMCVCMYIYLYYRLLFKRNTIKSRTMFVKLTNLFFNEFSIFT